MQKSLGDTADVVSDQRAQAETLSSLDNVKTIATYSLIGALVAGSVIIFLSMLMIVRERRREIGVLKAIGSSNARISWQFVTEALTLTGWPRSSAWSAGVILSNPVLDALVCRPARTDPGRSSSSQRPGPRWWTRCGGSGGGPIRSPAA